MKILYHHRIASRDGGSTHIEEMIKAFRALGHTVVVAAPAPSDAGGASSSGGIFAWLKSHLPKAVYEVMELGYSIVAYRRLSRIIRKEKPDFIYERYNLFLLSGIWARRRFNIPIVLEVNSPFAVERANYGGLSLIAMARWAERYVWKNADAVLPVSHVLADYVRGEGVADERIKVIPNGIDPASFKGLPSRAEAKSRYGLDGRIVVGFTGFVRDWDRLERVVTWMSRYRGEDPVHLFVVGDGPARADIERHAVELGLSDRVSFTGVVPREAVPAAARAFDIALQTNLLPYISPLCLFEYLESGVAIVAPDQPNHRELFGTGQGALLYDTENELALEACIERLCEDRGLREELAQAGPKVIRERRFTWRDHAETIVRIAEGCRQTFKSASAAVASETLK